MNKFCLVCGTPEQPAVPWIRHFGVESVCFSCGLFFSRSLARTYECRNTENCRALKVSSNFSQNGRATKLARKCRYCRLQRCLAVGMKPTMARLTRIKYEEKRQKILTILTKYTKNPANANDEEEDPSSEKEFVPLIPMKNMLTNNSDGQLAQSLLFVERKFHPAFNREIKIPDEICDQLFGCRDFGELVELSKKWNLLDAASNGRSTHFKESKWKEYLGDWAKIELLAKDVIFFLELARTMDVFHRMELDDQILLLNYNCLPALFFCRYFYCAEQNLESFTLPGHFPPVIAHYRIPKFEGDERVRKLAMNVCVHPIDEIKQAKLISEEMVVLRAIMFSNIAPSRLSQRAQELLQAETAKYSQLLLRMLQTRLGTMPGVRTFDRALCLIARCYKLAQTLRQLFLYLDIFYDNGEFAARLPRALKGMLSSG